MAALPMRFGMTVPLGRDNGADKFMVILKKWEEDSHFHQQKISALVLNQKGTI
jgi:hypothetical protein